MALEILSTFYNYRKIPNISPPNISPPNISPPKNKVKGEYQVQLFNLSKAGIYSNVIKRY